MVIDVSSHNTIKSWSTIAPQVEAVIIRVGYRGYGGGNIVLDSKFISNVEGCKKNNIPFGLYFMSQAITEAEAIQEADFTCNYAIKYGATLPIFIDSEWSSEKKTGRADGLSKATRTKICKAFCEEVKRYGFKTGVYANRSWFVNQLSVNELLPYKLWVAQYESTKCTAKHRVDMWQYSSKEKLNGVGGSGNIDKSIVYDMDILGKSVSVAKVNPYAEPTVIIKKGSKGDGAKWVQWWLKEKGYYSGKIDGIFGQCSYASLRSFQMNSNLKVDGLCGSATRKALKV